MKESFLKLKTMDLRYSNELNEGLITPPTENACKLWIIINCILLSFFDVCYTKQIIKENSFLILFILIIVQHVMLSLLWKQERTKHKTYINTQMMANERNWPLRHCKTNSI